MRVDIYSDIACPWCYIGQVRFERALAAFPGRADVEVSYRPHQLNPAMSDEPQPLLDYYLARGGAAFRDDHAALSDVAKGDGLALDLERALAVNTLAAHRLMWLAERDYDESVRHAVKHALMRTYLTDGGNVADPDTLVALARHAGMDPDRARADLADGSGTAEVTAAMRQADRLGIRAVPTFVFDDRLALRGAGDIATFQRVLEEVAARGLPSTPDTAACADGGCTSDIDDPTRGRTSGIQKQEPMASGTTSHTGRWRRVTTAAELVRAVRQGERAIEVHGVITAMPMLTLAPEVRLRGGTLEFVAKGLCLTRDNVLENVRIHTPEHEVAVLNDTSVTDFGTLALHGVHTRGQVLLLARDAVRTGHVVVNGLTVEAADLRGRTERPHGFGVEVLQGAFTLWNRQSDPGVEITAELLDIAAGSADSPIHGSGVFVGGHDGNSARGTAGTTRVTILRTREIHTDGRIPVGTADLISGGVFLSFGAVVDRVLNTGPVTTHGANDMVLDNWGRARSWTATAPLTSYGPSGIGFVNFGDLDRLDIQAAITTHGTGARGFNFYDGSLRHASFDSLTTTGDGAIGIQVGRDLPHLDVRGDLTTSGGTGISLVRGVQTRMRATALGITRSGRIGRARIGGRITARGDDVVTVEIDGELGTLNAHGGIHAEGRGADAVHIRGEGTALDAVAISAAHGGTTVRTPE
ncbi:DsbA family protein [Embleya sp. NPDC020630]|uniref:DsbA family protein n=1 Tax=Embleya sp. NPDC020630 TaxID=3363979 RepID=UPI003795752E